MTQQPPTEGRSATQASNAAPQPSEGDTSVSSQKAAGVGIGGALTTIFVWLLGVIFTWMCPLKWQLRSRPLRQL